jgi:hypothetical protein
MIWYHVVPMGATVVPFLIVLDFRGGGIARASMANAPSAMSYLVEALMTL